MEHFEIEDYFDFEQNEIYEKRKYLIVIIYDICNNKRRNKLSKLLQRYGFRVQKSAFECLLTKNIYENLLAELPKLIHSSDLLRVYNLSGKANVRIWGCVGKIEVDDVIII